MNSIFHQKYSSWRDLELAISGLSTNAEKGDAFEEFVYFYLSKNAELYQIEELYCPAATKLPFPNRIKEALRLERNDYGVDGVICTRQKKLIAFQSKFRTNREALTYRELATFWTEAEYADSRLIITNSSSLPDLAEKKTGHSALMSNVLDGLGKEIFDDLYAAATGTKKQVRKLKKPRVYQDEILKDLEYGLSSNEKGKLIAACGIGKTLISLWLSERRNDNLVLFLAPSLQLIRQTLGEWAKEASHSFDYLCVCSDNTVNIYDETNIANAELDIPVTTDASTVKNFLSGSNAKKRVIFSTYQSVPVLRDGLANQAVMFDIAFFDEAHRTAGVSNLNLFTLALSNDNIPVKCRLFMTATERVLRPRLKALVEGTNAVVFSMDDPAKYGPTLHRLSFGAAIKRKIVSDYRIVFAGITKSDLNEYISRNRYVSEDLGSEQDETEPAQSVYKRILLKKCIHELSLRKIISFHNKVSESKAFAKKFLSNLTDESLGNIAVSHIDGTMSSVDRSIYIREFEEADTSVLSNVRCLTEGVDIPLIDAVYFANPKGSIIDIVQAVGRALRQPFGSSGKLAYIILPVLIDEASQIDLTSDDYEALFNIIQALRDQDESLAEWIDHINLEAVTGRKPSRSGTGKLTILLPSKFDTLAFESSLLLKIAEVNRDPAGRVGIGGKLGKKERKSSYTRTFKTLCDYTPEKVYESLVKPTFDRIKNPTGRFSGPDIRFNNNNVSHCERLGIIERLDKNEYFMTPLGRSLKSNDINFKDLFMNQMLLYGYETGVGKLCPYREAFKFMRSVKEIGFIDFVYGLYSLQLDADGIAQLDNVITSAKTIQKTFPNLELTSDANKSPILESLNSTHPIGFPYNDVWTDRTTTGNQFRYLVRHLELFDELFVFRNKRLYIKSESEVLLDKYLEITQPLLTQGYGTIWWVNKRSKE
jgi:superfamily II DNA or RNA helicase